MWQSGRPMLSRKSQVMVAAAQVSMVLSFNSTAFGQSCSSSGTSVSQSNGAGTLRVQSQTTATPDSGGSCSSRTTKVRNYISGRVYECSGETTQGYCVDEATGGNAVTTAMDDGCGTWAGNGMHEYREGGGTTNLSNSSVSLNGGVCSGECELIDDQNQCTLNSTCYWENASCHTPTSPIIIATGKNARYELTSAADGVTFDIDGDGNVEQMSWTMRNSPIAFLAIDRDGDGQITSGKELFGNFTRPGSPNGFDALQKMAMESNGGIARHSVSNDDPLFSRLLLWTDSNHNGVSEPEELRPASDLVSDIGLGYQIRKTVDEHGNAFTFRSWVHIRTKPGRDQVKNDKANNERTRHIWDVYLQPLR